MSTPSVRSVNVGATTTQRGARGRARRTGIVKEPVAAIEVRDPVVRKGAVSGVLDDVIASKKHHGGRYQAVYAVAREELNWWGAELGRELPDGMFGENLTTENLAVDESIVGEQWRIGEAVLQVSGPRVPCATFATRMGEPRWVRRFTERGRTGAYLMVIEPGRIRPGDLVEVVARPEHGVTVPTFFAAICGDHAALEQLLAADCIADPQFRAELAR
ncbi:MAG: MOSC domain-containing protein [Actinomycetia bacterium]|nr:MOSC domain-containing protein [Actinomycetes bacterium]